MIIPVYNAAAYVTQAVESALAQPETAEVLLIEDGSPDNALEVCEELASMHDKVRLLRHPNGENRGAGASRNLGMRNAKFDFIAFLDADDFYLPERFCEPSKIFDENLDCEGVYEAVGMLVEDEQSMRRWKESGKIEGGLTTISKTISPANLAEELILGNAGYFHIDGLVIKRSVLEKSGFMDETLVLHQDSEFCVRVAAVSTLYPGRLDHPVAIRRVHDQNRISAPRSQMKQFKDRMKYWMSLYRWSKINLDKDKQELILMSIKNFARTHKYFAKFPRKLFPTRLIWFIRSLRLLAYPEIILDVIKK